MQDMKEQVKEPKNGESTTKQNQSNTSNSSKTKTHQQDWQPTEGDTDSEVKGVAENFHPKGERNENPMEQEDGYEKEQDDDQEDSNYKNTSRNESEAGRKNEPNDLKEAEDNYIVNY